MDGPANAAKIPYAQSVPADHLLGFVMMFNFVMPGKSPAHKTRVTGSSRDSARAYQRCPPQLTVKLQQGIRHMDISSLCRCMAWQSEQPRPDPQCHLALAQVPQRVADLTRYHGHQDIDRKIMNNARLFNRQRSNVQDLFQWHPGGCLALPRAASCLCERPHAQLRQA